MREYSSPTSATHHGKTTAFLTTRWTQVLATRGETPEAKAALADLCETYWTPVFRFLRREGRDDDTAREMTQDFFAGVLSRNGLTNAAPGLGRFRSFLLGAVKHFLVDRRDRERAAKRGGGIAVESLDRESTGDDSTATHVADPNAPPADTYFDREWAFAIMDRSFARLTEELAANGKLDQFFVLKPWLVGDLTTDSQAAAAQKLGLSEGAVKVAIHRLRKRFRELVRSEIAHTMPDNTSTDEELRYLVEVLAAK